MKAKNLKGQRFGRWTVLEFSHRDNRRQAYWLCRCECGKEKIVVQSNLTCFKSTQCKSCKATKERTTHGLKNHPLYVVWSNIKDRCFRKNNHAFKYYGGRGITICNEWRNNPKAFIEWALSHGWQKGLQIDRINNDGNYEHSNCRFVTTAINARNKGNIKLTEEKVKDIRSDLLRGVSWGKIAIHNHVVKGTIGHIKSGRNWKEVAL